RELKKLYLESEQFDRALEEKYQSLHFLFCRFFRLNSCFFFFFLATAGYQHCYYNEKYLQNIPPI
ncbi:MAG TPA: hypothetical protein PL048_04235, partial [Leptospiraceae bacterium]|nr:hypothetical protein [Leptospiraceae bacterium]